MSPDQNTSKGAASDRRCDSRSPLVLDDAWTPAQFGRHPSASIVEPSTACRCVHGSDMPQTHRQGAKRSRPVPPRDTRRPTTERPGLRRPSGVAQADVADWFLPTAGSPATVRQRTRERSSTRPLGFDD